MWCTYRIKYYAVESPWDRASSTTVVNWTQHFVCLGCHSFFCTFNFTFLSFHNLIPPHPLHPTPPHSSEQCSVVLKDVSVSTDRLFVVAFRMCKKSAFSLEIFLVFVFFQPAKQHSPKRVFDNPTESHCCLSETFLHLFHPIFPPVGMAH